MVERLRETREISGHRPLVVVGGGAGGVAAALAASSSDVPTVLVERAISAFSTQASVQTRFVDPTQYDWPVDHWEDGQVVPSRFPPLPIPLQAQYANAMAAGWSLALGRARAAYGAFLDVRFSRQVTRVTKGRASGAAGSPHADWLEVALDDGSRHDAGAVVWAIGHGSENTSVPDPAAPSSQRFSGVPFWKSDRLSALTPGRHRVLISGSGDGALQDYLRALTGEDHVRQLALGLALPDDICRAVQSAEDRAHRGRAWLQASRNAEAPWLDELEAVHGQSVARALRLPSVIAGIEDFLRPGQPRTEVHLVHRGPHLTCYYGLNRFLVLLFSRYLKERFGFDTVHSDHALVSVSPDPAHHHACNTSTNGCFGLWHMVQFHNGATLPSGNRFNVIVVRHGIEPVAPWPSWKPLPTRSQLIPYHRP